MNNIENNNVSAEPSIDTSNSASNRKFKVPEFVNYKTLSLVLAVALFVGIGYQYKSWFVAATVNGKPISRLAVIHELEKQSGREALESLINERLINDEANKLNIRVTEQEVDDRVKQIETEVAQQQNGTLDEMLQVQGMTRQELRDQIVLQKKAEQIVKDKTQVSDEEVTQYITESGQILGEGKEEEQRKQIKDGLEQQKFSQEITAWLEEARKNATIKEFVIY